MAIPATHVESLSPKGAPSSPPPPHCPTHNLFRGSDSREAPPQISHWPSGPPPILAHPIHPRPSSCPEPPSQGPPPPAPVQSPSVPPALLPGTLQLKDLPTSASPPFIRSQALCRRWQQDGEQADSGPALGGWSSRELGNQNPPMLMGELTNINPSLVL